MDKFLARMTKGKKKKNPDTQIINIRSEIWNITLDPTTIERIIREEYEQFNV